MLEFHPQVSSLEGSCDVARKTLSLINSSELSKREQRAPPHWFSSSQNQDQHRRASLDTMNQQQTVAAKSSSANFQDQYASRTHYQTKDSEQSEGKRFRVQKAGRATKSPRPGTSSEYYIDSIVTPTLPFDASEFITFPDSPSTPEIPRPRFSSSTRTDTNINNSGTTNFNSTLGASAQQSSAQSTPATTPCHCQSVVLKIHEDLELYKEILDTDPLDRGLQLMKNSIRECNSTLDCTRCRSSSSHITLLLSLCGIMIAWFEHFHSIAERQPLACLELGGIEQHKGNNQQTSAQAMISPSSQNDNGNVGNVQQTAESGLHLGDYKLDSEEEQRHMLLVLVVMHLGSLLQLVSTITALARSYGFSAHATRAEKLERCAQSALDVLREVYQERSGVLDRRQKEKYSEASDICRDSSLVDQFSANLHG